jgi:S1-C subfamily serine protease
MEALMLERRWIGCVRNSILSLGIAGWLAGGLPPGSAVAQTMPAPPSPEAALPNALDQLLSAVVRIKTFINPDARTAESLGRERDGSGILIDDNGLILTIGYLMVEAHSAQVIQNDGRIVAATIVGYDHDTGFGLLRAQEAIKAKPMPFGKASDIKERDRVLAASFGGRDGVAPAYVVSKRDFAGPWEYLVEQAFYTAPAHSHWSGAALISREGKLIGVGSLILQDISGGKERSVAGNLYVPIDTLPPILADLIAEGRPAGPARPWLGISTTDLEGRLLVARVTPGGPAEAAGVKRGDIVLGVNGEKTGGLADFYRKIWKQGAAGITVKLDVLQDNAVRSIDVKSMNRLDHLKLKSTF